MAPYSEPRFFLSAFNCPICGAYANQEWYKTMKIVTDSREFVMHGEAEGIILCNCGHCDKHSIWVNEKLVYPFTGTAPLPNVDMPEDVKFDYEEARSIVNQSPRGAAALLRLAIQKICKHLGEKGEDLNTDIGNLVQKGLPVKLQQALDSVRVIGNNAVHPGQIDITDDVDTANKLFVFINIYLL